MECKQFSNLLEAYAAGQLTGMERHHMEAHAKACVPCQRMLAAYQDCQALGEDEAVPLAFTHGWRQMLKEEGTMQKAPPKRRQWQGFAAVVAVLMLLVGGTALTRGGSLYAPKNTDNDVLMGRYAAQSTVAPQANTYAGGGDNGVMLMKSMADTASYESEVITEGQMDEKIIRTASITLKTQSFEQDLTTLQELATGLGGRIEYQYVSGDLSVGTLRTARLTLRIPQNKLDEFIESSEGIAQVTSQQQSSTDVSESYYDLASRLGTQKEKLTRLQALMETATTVSELVEIENALSDTQYMIEYYTGQLQGYDSRIAYSSVDVTLREITLEESDDLTLWQRITNGVQNSLNAGLDFLQDMVVFVIAILPWVLIAGVVILIITITIKKRK